MKIKSLYLNQIFTILVSFTDPTLTVDIDRMNMEFIDKSEEFYLAVEDSRWFAIDNITTTYDDICKK